MKLLDNSTIVTGILYQHRDSSDTQLLGGLTIDIKLFDNIPITGLIYRQERSAEDKILSGVKVTGVVYRHADDLDDVILRSSRIRGVIFQSRSADLSEVARGSDNVDASSRVRGSLEQGLPEGSQIVGLICHKKDTGEEQVITGPRVNLKILNSYSVVGIMYEGPDEESIKRLTGSNITGLLFQQQKADNETILGDMALVGIIYQDKGVISERLSAFASFALDSCERCSLYTADFRHYRSRSANLARFLALRFPCSPITCDHVVTSPNGDCPGHHPCLPTISIPEAAGVIARCFLMRPIAQHQSEQQYSLGTT